MTMKKIIAFFLAAGTIMNFSALAAYKPYTVDFSQDNFIEAEDFDEGVQGEAWYDTTPANNMYKQYRKNVGVDIAALGTAYSVNMTTGEWLNYTIDVSEAGKYSMWINCATTADKNKMSVSVGGSEVISQNYVRKTALSSTTIDFDACYLGDIELTEGENIIKLTCNNGTNVIVDNIILKENKAEPYKRLKIPGTINCYEYDTGGLYSMENVNGSYYVTDDTVVCTEFRTTDHLPIRYADNVNFGITMSYSYWINYTVNVEYDENYAVWMQGYINPNTTANEDIYVDGELKIKGAVTPKDGVPASGGEYSWFYLGSVELTAGEHKIQIKCPGGAVHFYDRLKFEVAPELDYVGTAAYSDNGETALLDAQNTLIDRDITGFKISYSNKINNESVENCAEIVDKSGNKLKYTATASDNTVEIVLENPLDYLAEYTLKIKKDIITDIYGNKTDEYTYSFTTCGGDLEVLSVGIDSENPKSVKAMIRNNTYTDTKTAVLVSVLGDEITKSDIVTILPRRTEPVAAFYNDALTSEPEIYIWDSLDKMQPVLGNDLSWSGMESVKLETAYVDYNKNELNITGTAKGEGIVTILVKKSDDVVMIGEATPGENGSFLKTFSLENADVGEYSIYVSANGISMPVDSTVTYFEKTEVENVALLFKNATSPHVISELFDNEELEVVKKLSLNNPLFDTANKDEIYALIYSRQAEIDVNDVTSVKKIFDEVLIINLILNSNNSEIVGVLGEYVNILSLQNADLFSIYSALSEEEKTKVIGFAKFDNAIDADDIAECLSLAVAKYKISSVASYHDVPGILAAINEYLDAQTVYSSYLNLSDKTNADKYFVLNSAAVTRDEATAGDIKRLFETAVSQAAATQNNNNNYASASGSTSKGGGSIPVVVPNNQQVNQETTTSKPKFSDVSENHWAFEYISALTDDGIINGKGENIFAPEDLIVREEFVKLLSLAMGYVITDAGNEFVDVNKNAWYAPYISVAHEKGIINGIDAERFGVGEHITREQMAAIIYRAVSDKIRAYEQLNFSDESEISEYAKEAVSKLSAAGIIGGYQDDTFRPQDILSRAQAAKVIKLVCDLIK